MVQTNFLAFLILWKVQRFEQSQKYIAVCKKFIHNIIENNEGEIFSPNETQFSAFASQNAVNSTDESPHRDELNAGQSAERAESPRFKKIIDHLMQSDHEMDQPGDVDRSPPILKVERMSFLSKLNLLGLVSLSEIVLRLKLDGNLGDAIRLLERAIKDLQAWNESKLKPSSQPANHIGIASQNIMEEYLDRLRKAKDIEDNEEDL